MKGKIIIKLLSKEHDKLGVEVLLMYRKYKGYLLPKTEISILDGIGLNIGKDRVHIEKLMRNDVGLMKKVCINPKDIIELDYNYNNRKYKLHLEKQYELHYDGFRESEK